MAAVPGTSTSEYRFIIGAFAPTGPVEPKFRVEGVTSNHSSSRLNDLSCGIKIWRDLSSVLPQCTRLTDEPVLYSAAAATTTRAA